MNAQRIVRFGANPPTSEKGQPSNLVAGKPETTLQNYYTDASGSFFAGVWESTAGKWRVSYAEDEFCAIVSGKVVLTGADGVAEAFSAGDAFVIPAGFTGIWETVEPVRKLYAIHERKA
ncbi:MAG: cupin domain-containing protein [Dongiaceae bacterium]